MNNEIILHRNEIAASPSQNKLSDLALHYIQRSKSENTINNYRHSLLLFRRYMNDEYQMNLEDFRYCLSVTPDMVSNYLSYLTSDERKQREKLKPLKASSVQRHHAALAEFFGYVEDQAGKQTLTFVNPVKSVEVKKTMAGIRRELGMTPKQKRAATPQVITMILNEIPMDGLTDLRDATMISLGFAGAFRRSELVALDMDHLTFDDLGVYIRLEHSKTDQEGTGMTKLISYGERAASCPVRLLQRWLRNAGIKEGAIFRSIRKGGEVGNKISTRSVATIIKARAEQAGLQGIDFSGHSLRRGFITHAYESGLAPELIMTHTGHKRFETMRKYIELIDIKKNNVTKGLY
ncbi:site-specific integrase [Shimazuella kribbensis]|uniref:site-specific integrase n=1 Tax=Shimazuella kribbensis TaxID=139808 RepID=UPI000427931E|nr:site-specific integrase [Shimazuella kribbensis]